MSAINHSGQNSTHNQTNGDAQTLRDSTRTPNEDQAGPGQHAEMLAPIQHAPSLTTVNPVEATDSTLRPILPTTQLPSTGTPGALPVPTLPTTPSTPGAPGTSNVNIGFLVLGMVALVLAALSSFYTCWYIRRRFRQQQTSVEGQDTSHGQQRSSMDPAHRHDATSIGNQSAGRERAGSHAAEWIELTPMASGAAGGSGAHSGAAGGHS
ncbi:hypothetical protein F5Y13DRAFT_206508 [Hypoxylon sp. FL1857]|nr:hypothetical protein F5Y13DRAFT_206508 [Hypoxylon sp. FL1857]